MIVKHKVIIFNNLNEMILDILRSWKLGNEMQVIQFHSLNFNISDFKGSAKLNMDNSDIPSIIPNIKLDSSHIKKTEGVNDDNDDKWNAMDFDSLGVTHWLIIIGACLDIFISITMAIYCMYIGYKRRVNNILKISSNTTNGFEEITLHDVRKPSGEQSSGAIGQERGVTSAGMSSEAMTSGGVSIDTVGVDSAPPSHQGCGHCGWMSRVVLRVLCFDICVNTLTHYVISSVTQSVLWFFIFMLLIVFDHAEIID